jgi:hypothetical protein
VSAILLASSGWCHTSRAWPPAAYSPGAWLRYALDTSQ